MVTTLEMVLDLLSTDRKYLTINEIAQSLGIPRTTVETVFQRNEVYFDFRLQRKDGPGRPEKAYKLSEGLRGNNLFASYIRRLSGMYDRLDRENRESALRDISVLLKRYEKIK